MMWLFGIAGQTKMMGRKMKTGQEARKRVSIIVQILEFNWC